MAETREPRGSGLDLKISVNRLVTCLPGIARCIGCAGGIRACSASCSGLSLSVSIEKLAQLLRCLSELLKPLLNGFLVVTLSSLLELFAGGLDVLDLFLAKLLAVLL